MRLTESIIFFRDKRNELLSYEKIWRKLKCIFLSHNEWLAFICDNLKRLLAVCCSVLSHVQLFVTPWTEAHQVSLSFTVSEFTQTRVLWGNDAIQPFDPLSSASLPAFNLHCLQSFPVSQLFASGGQSIGASASASVLPVNIKDWLPLGLTGLISLQFRGLSGIFSNTTVQTPQFFGTLLSF